MYRMFYLTTNQKQVINLNVNNRNINLYITYNSIDETWILSIYEKEMPLICGIRLTTGYDNLIKYNILEQYEYLGIGKLYIFTEDLITPSTKTLANTLLVWEYAI